MSDKQKSAVASPSPSPETAQTGGQGGTDILPASYWQQVPVAQDPEVTADDNDSLFDDSQSSTASLTESILRYRTIQGRTYHSTAVGTAEAWQPNDETHTEAMDMNHHLCTLVLGDKLFLAPIPDHVQNMLDIGTGTGIWAM